MEDRTRSSLCSQSQLLAAAPSMLMFVVVLCWIRFAGGAEIVAEIESGGRQVRCGHTHHTLLVFFNGGEATSRWLTTTNTTQVT